MDYQDKPMPFLVTEIGCGLAGFTPEQIAPMFKECYELENVIYLLGFGRYYIKVNLTFNFLYIK